MGLFDNLFQSIDDSWNGRLTHRGGQQAGSAASKWDSFMGGLNSLGSNLGKGAETLGNAQATHDENGMPLPQSRGSADIQSQGSGFGGGVTGSFDPSPSSPDLSLTGNNSPAPESKLLQLLQEAINNKDQYDSGPYMSNLDSARSASLKAIADARGQLQGNFDQSNQAIQGIYAKGKQDTLSDNSVLQASNENLVGGLGNVYDGSISQLQDDRSKEMNERAEMEQRLGLQASGLDGVGDVQTKAIADASKAKASAQDRASQYGGADIAENTARAEGLIGEGASRQAALRSQLSGLLGQLSNKELDVNNQYANSAMQARNQAYQDNLSRISSLYGMYDKEQSRAQSTQNSILKSPVIAKLLTGGGGSMTGNQGANALIAQQGANPQDYNSAYTDAIMESNAMPGSDPTDQMILQKMVEKGMDKNLALSYIQAAKQNKSTVSTGGSDLSTILPLLMGMG